MPKNNNNPTGRGGFRENPQNRASGRWDKTQSITYQYNYLIRLSVAEFKKWEKNNPESKRTMAMEIAYRAVFKSRGDIKYLREITDRTEGRAKQAIDLTSDGEQLNNFTNEQIARIADRIARRRRGAGSTSGTKPTN